MRGSWVSFRRLSWHERVSGLRGGWVTGDGLSLEQQGLLVRREDLVARDEFVVGDIDEHVGLGELLELVLACEAGDDLRRARSRDVHAPWAGLAHLASRRGHGAREDDDTLLDVLLVHALHQSAATVLSSGSTSRYAARRTFASS
jgi:hypothetical protein